MIALLMLPKLAPSRRRKPFGHIELERRSE
jgi:hypothetical protein